MYNQSCLIIVDVQNDFCTDGALAVMDGEAVVPVCNQLMAHFSHIVLTQDWHDSDHSSFADAHPGKAPFAVVPMDYGDQVLWPRHCVKGTSGANFHPQLNTGPARMIIRKGTKRDIDSYSAFMENDKVTPTGLEGYLHKTGIKHVYICGLALDYCVAWSALDARSLGFDVTVMTDACRAIDRDNSLTNAMNALKAAGVMLSDLNQFHR